MFLSLDCDVHEFMFGENKFKCKVTTSPQKKKPGDKKPKKMKPDNFESKKKKINKKINNK